jgi:TolA-binding protein
VARNLSAERAVLALAERRHDAALASGQLELALEYLEIAPLFLLFDALPEQVLWRFGGTHRALAERMLADAHEANPPSETDPLALDPGVRSEVSRHYREAGDAFVARADSLIDSLTDDDEWADSTWLAADSYDHGGYHELAIAQFAQYVANRPDTDPRRVEAEFRLAQCHHAAGQTEAAAALFESVIAQHPDSPFATHAHLPLADCYAVMGLHAQAEQQLLHVVSGHEHVGPEAVDYREALFALGTLYYNDGDFRRAVEELTRAIERYPDDLAVTSLRFRLADSYRSLARAIDDAIAAGEIARPELDAMRDLRANHLREAMTLFAQVEDDYAEVPAERLDTLQRDERRLAAMYLADGAYDLGEYQNAIDLYDRAATEWSDHPSSLVALVQIVNCHTALGDHAAAGAAHHRALLRLSQLPPSAFDGEDALFDETAWKQWLEGLPPGSTAVRNPSRDVSDASSSH